MSAASLACEALLVAQGALGLIHYAGKMCPTANNQLVSGFCWPVHRGDQNAVKLRDFLESSLSPEQLAAAQAAACNWQPKTFP